MQIHYNLPDVSRKSFGGSMELESLTCTEQSVISTHERLSLRVYKLWNLEMKISCGIRCIFSCFEIIISIR